VEVRCEQQRALFSISDTGVGITEENKSLIFENYFTTSATSKYATRKPFDFNAGGGGFDLLRIKLFSERYHYKITTTSNRCPFIPNEEDACPGDTTFCKHLKAPDECFSSGGTTISVEFPAETFACTL
jgi:signal transduction histidine kinase